MQNILDYAQLSNNAIRDRLTGVVDAFTPQAAPGNRGWRSTDIAFELSLFGSTRNAFQLAMIDRK